MKAKVIAATTIDNEPTTIGDIVDVDPKTFRNLHRKGRLESAEPEPPAKPKRGAKKADPAEE